MDLSLVCAKSLRRVVGLRNLGNTCYLNAVLQSLASISSLHVFLAENQKHLLNRQPLTEALRETITELSLNHGRPIEPPKSIRDVKQLSGMLSSREQQDAHELMQLLMNILDDEHGQSYAPTLANASSLSHAKKRTSAFSSPFFVAPYHPLRGTALSSLTNQLLPHFGMKKDFARTIMSMSAAREGISLSDVKAPSKNPFYGLLSNTMKCNDCGRESTPHYQKFFGLSLPMPEVDELPSSKECTLEKCLDLFVGQMVEGVAWDHVPLQKVIPTSAHLVAGDVEMFIKSQSVIDPTRPFDSIPASRPLRTLEQMTSALLSPPPSSSLHCCATGVCNAFLNCNIAKPPTSLCLHLRRLIALAGGNVKLETHVQFPLHLNLSAYCKTGLAGEQERSVDYRLSSVIVHNGDVNGGHFTCFRHVLAPEFGSKEEYQKCINEAASSGNLPFSEEGGVWFDISDDKYSVVDEAQVLACNAYMLYYELRRDVNVAQAGNGIRLGVWNRSTSSAFQPFTPSV